MAPRNHSYGSAWKTAALRTSDWMPLKLAVDCARRPEMDTCDAIETSRDAVARSGPDVGSISEREINGCTCQVPPARGPASPRVDGNHACSPASFLQGPREPPCVSVARCRRVAGPRPGVPSYRRIQHIPRGSIALDPQPCGISTTEAGECAAYSHLFKQRPAIAAASEAAPPDEMPRVFPSHRRRRAVAPRVTARNCHARVAPDHRHCATHALGCAG